MRVPYERVAPVSLTTNIRRWWSDWAAGQTWTGHSIPINSLVYIFSGFLSVFTAEYCENL